MRAREFFLGCYPPPPQRLKNKRKNDYNALLFACDFFFRLGLLRRGESSCSTTQTDLSEQDKPKIEAIIIIYFCVFASSKKKKNDRKFIQKKKTKLNFSRPVFVSLFRVYISVHLLALYEVSLICVFLNSYFYLQKGSSVHEETSPGHRCPKGFFFFFLKCVIIILFLK